MNICNFAKVIISRATKDNNLEDSLTNPSTAKPVYNNCISTSKRYQNYMTIMNKYPKMHIGFDWFRRRVLRIQSYVTDNKHYKSSNKHSEKQNFLSKFSLHSWLNSSESAKRQHKFFDCYPCQSTYVNESSDHKSTTASDLISRADEVLDISANQSGSAQQNLRTLFRIMTPAVSEKFNIEFKDAACNFFDLEPKKVGEVKRNQIKKEHKKSREEFVKIVEKEGEVQRFLESGKSYAEYDRQRLTNFFESTQSAKERTKIRKRKEASGLIKKKNHVGNLQAYKVNEGYVKYLKKLAPGTTVNWSKLASQFALQKTNGKSVKNPGQVMRALASHQGINTAKFCKPHVNTRVRRAKQHLKYGFKTPVPPSAKDINYKIKRKLSSKEIKLGEKIAPKIIATKQIHNDGTLKEVTKSVYGRKIQLVDIRQEMLNEQMTKGLFRKRAPDTYDKDLNEITSMINDVVGERHMDSNDEARSLLQKIHHTRHLKMWHDHSDILNHSYVCFMVSTIYDPLIFLTNDEYVEQNPDLPPVDVPSLVERPHLYILGQSKSSDKDQLSYTEERVADLKSLQVPILSPEYKVPIYDVMRIFSGDGPARQFEAGHQRGGNFSCLCGIRTQDHTNLECALSVKVPSLGDRLDIFRGGILWRRFSLENPNPFGNLLKDDLLDELDNRGIKTSHLQKPALQNNLNETLKGIQRPPALLCLDHQDVLNHLKSYEIAPCEPLHDITSVVQNVITELPYQLPNKDAQKEFQSFYSSTIGDKNQIKGSDARLFAVKLAKFAHQEYILNKVDKDVFDLCFSLVQIITLCYAHHDTRSPKAVLRLYNQAFIFSVLCTKIFNQPKKMSTRKFFGAHFHCLTTHSPEIYRIFCLRSLVPEQEERTFGDLRSISERTSNRQSGKIIDNCVMRYRAQMNREDRKDSFRRQDTAVSQQARLLPLAFDSKFSLSFITSRPFLFQRHCERIADYLVAGEGIWWSLQGRDVVFHDGPDHPTSRKEGPLLSHFRAKCLSDVTSYILQSWETCLDLFKQKAINLPMEKIKIFEDGKLQDVIRNKVEDQVRNLNSTNVCAAKSTYIETSNPDEEISITLVDNQTTMVDDITETDSRSHSKVEEQFISSKTSNPDEEISTTLVDNQTTMVDDTTKRDSRSYSKADDLTTRKVCTSMTDSKPTPKGTKKLPVKRKLFSPSEDIQTTTDIILELLGDNDIVKDYMKYRRLHKSNPTDKLCKESHDKALCKIEMAVSKVHNSLKEGKSSNDIKKRKYAEKLLNHWGTYYY